ncbi:enoyl-CoA delta isomerase 2-like [Onthophagus taurus]|uniref:enoyl-CoA delta isomerase 2-like n=1 Tax=Onthophagus taurus TaxID=166361 RepID=UPI000C2010DE|nr:enoyl-CoA delta isomerase 2, mitochondrial-like [Onthophagus taurus]
MDRLLISFKNGVRTIKFNMPSRKNAVSHKVYKELGKIFNEDAENDKIIVTIITGFGEYFTSGNDFKAIMEYASEDGMPEVAHQAFKNFIKAFIDYPKIIIGVVNGPAVGIGATLLGLCDIAYASDKATFHAPFLRLGLCCEGASSLHFPLTMGRSRASEMLLLAKKITAQEAEKFGLVSKVIPHEQLDSFIEELHQYGDLPLNAVKINKKLIVDNYRQWFHDSNLRECTALEERAASEDFMNSVISFMNKKSKM